MSTDYSILSTLPNPSQGVLEYHVGHRWRRYRQIMAILLLGLLCLVFLSILLGVKAIYDANDLSSHDAFADLPTYGPEAFLIVLVVSLVALLLFAARIFLKRTVFYGKIAAAWNYNADIKTEIDSATQQRFARDFEQYRRAYERTADHAIDFLDSVRDKRYQVYIAKHKRVRKEYRSLLRGAKRYYRRIPEPLKELHSMVARAKRDIERSWVCGPRSSQSSRLICPTKPEDGTPELVRLL